MMRAGKLDRMITLQRVANTVDEYGTPQMAWANLATLRAQIVQASTEEYLRDAGAKEETAIVFRTRFFDGVTTADRVSYGAALFNVKEVKEIGRRQGLEIRAVAT